MPHLYLILQICFSKRVKKFADGHCGASNPQCSCSKTSHQITYLIFQKCRFTLLAKSKPSTEVRINLINMTLCVVIFYENVDFCLDAIKPWFYHRSYRYKREIFSFQKRWLVTVEIPPGSKTINTATIFISIEILSQQCTKRNAL